MKTISSLRVNVHFMGQWSQCGRPLLCNVGDKYSPQVYYPPRYDKSLKIRRFLITLKFKWHIAFCVIVEWTNCITIRIVLQFVAMALIVASGTKGEWTFHLFSEKAQCNGHSRRSSDQRTSKSRVARGPLNWSLIFISCVSHNFSSHLIVGLVN